MNPSSPRLRRWSNRILALGLLALVFGAGLHACGSGLEKTVLPNPSMNCKTDSCIR